MADRIHCSALEAGTDHVNKIGTHYISASDQTYILHDWWQIQSGYLVIASQTAIGYRMIPLHADRTQGVVLTPIESVAHDHR